MSKSNAYFMVRMETDPEFRREVELAELRHVEPELPTGEGAERDFPGQDPANQNLVEPIF
jgi:hypothetical protein